MVLRGFAASFMHLKLRRECKEDFRRWEKARQGLEFRVGGEIVSFLHGGHFKGVLTQIHKNNRQGWFKTFR